MWGSAMRRRLHVFSLVFLFVLNVLNVSKITFQHSFVSIDRYETSLTANTDQSTLLNTQKIEKIVKEKTSVPLSITSVGEVLTSSETPLTVTARFTNTSPQPVEVIAFRLNVESRFASTRSDVINFLHGRPSPLLVTRSSLTEPRTLQAGQSTEVSLTWEHGTLAFADSMWGARGVEVEAVTKDQVFTDRSFVVVAPAHEIQPSPMAALVSVGRDANSPWNVTDALSSAVAQTSASPTSPSSPEGSTSPSQAPPSQPSSTPSTTPLSRDENETSLNLPSATSTLSENTTGSTSSISPSQTPVSPSETSSHSSETSEQNEQSTNAARLELVQQLQSLAHRGITFSLDSTAADLLHPKDIDTINSAGAYLQLGALSNAHLSALAQHCSGNSECLQSWTKAGRAISEQQGSSLGLSSDVALLNSSATSESFAALQSLGVSKALLPASAVPTDDDKYSTPSARTSVHGLPVLVSDSALNAVASGKIPSHADADAVQQESTSSFSSTFDSFHARQLALALSSATYRERPNDSRLVVVQTHASHTAGPDDLENVVLSELLKAPWVKPMSIPEAFASGEASTDRVPADENTDTSRYSSEEDTQGLPTSSLSSEMLTSMDNSRALYQKIGGIVQESSVLEDVVNRRIAALISSGWETKARRIAVTEFDSGANAMLSGIVSLDSSTINVISNSTEIPVTVENSLPVTVNVRVKLHSQDPRLTATGSVETRISPGGTSKVLIPVRAFGSANITAQVHITDNEGNKVGTTRDISLRVRANWEDIGTLVFAGFFLLLLIFGLWKSLRRGRRSRPLSPEEVRLARIQASADSHALTGE